MPSLNTSKTSALPIFVCVVVSLLAHMLIVGSCVVWWEVYKFNVNWNLHTGRPLPSLLYLFYMPSWFWVDLVITVIIFSSFAVLLVLVILLAKALNVPKLGFIVAVVFYNVLLLANWIWYEIFRANVKTTRKIDPDPDALRYLLWADAMYIFTNIIGFLAVLVFISRAVLPRTSGVEGVK